MDSVKKYQIIYADPPWSYRDKRLGYKDPGVEQFYETQSQEWICSLPIPKLCSEDCVLFLWATSPLLPEAFEVMKAWGFKYRTLAFCWVKETPLFNTVKNLGHWTMGGVELCLLGVKGKPKRITNNIKQLVFEIRSNHSTKPEEVRRRIVKLMGNLPRIELFAREKTEGWDVWGNEVESDIKL